GISHKEAHRALADSKATIKLLEKLLQVYSGFPENLKIKIVKLISGHGFAWEDFLNIGFSPLQFSQVIKPKALMPSLLLPLKLEANVVYNFSLDADQCGS